MSFLTALRLSKHADYLAKHPEVDVPLSKLLANIRFWKKCGLLLPSYPIQENHVFKTSSFLRIVADAMEIDTYGYPLIQRWSSPGLYGRMNPEGRKQYAHILPLTSTGETT